MKQRAEIIFEIEETVVVRERATIEREYCALCADAVALVTPCQAAALSGKTEREIFRLIERGRLHFSEKGRVMICLESIKRFNGGFN